MDIIKLKDCIVTNIDSVTLKQICKELISLANDPEIKLMMHGGGGYKVKWEITVIEKYPIMLGG